jgi:hypothetical protein
VVGIRLHQVFYEIFHAKHNPYSFQHLFKMMYRVKPLVTSLSLLSLSAAVPFPPSPNQFGLVGPQNAMLFLNGFHFISGEPSHFLHANHHCTIMSSSFIQCAIYVPGTNPARLAGIEYIVTGEAFAKLPMEERQLWHSHQYEVSSGLLVEPGIPDGVDNEIMKILVNSYGKTTHTWRYDQKGNDLPLGIPEMVNGYTGDGQLSQAAIDQRDKFFELNSTAIRNERKGVIKVPDVLDGADAWKKGFVLTLELANKTVKSPF